MTRPMGLAGCGAWLGATMVLLTMYALTLFRPELASRQTRRERRQ